MVRCVLLSMSNNQAPCEHFDPLNLDPLHRLSDDFLRKPQKHAEYSINLASSRDMEVFNSFLLIVDQNFTNQWTMCSAKTVSMTNNQAPCEHFDPFNSDHLKKLRDDYIRMPKRHAEYLINLASSCGLIKVHQIVNLCEQRPASDDQVERFRCEYHKYIHMIKATDVEPAY
ncbi:hypothetical protein SSS_04970 [Sarcoptes scabiei]|uniref:Uncharacterized protein n=1 Tax=Sarcoptes scabiei TaxID=52283 RepID=A0A834RJC4_SARSC|nr:hypothetical protein SSS_04970 [Sarcoptes scabiei]